MARFRIVLSGRYGEQVDAERGAAIIDGVRRLIFDAESVRDPLDGAFDFVINVEAATENEAQSFARAAVVSALFDAGFNNATAFVEDVATRPLH